MKVEKARITDGAQMHKLINKFANKGEMLPRALSEIYEYIRDYFVVRDGDKLVACVALHVSWSDLAEVKSLAVVEGSQQTGTHKLSKGLGRFEQGRTVFRCYFASETAGRCCWRANQLDGPGQKMGRSVHKISQRYRKGGRKSL